MMVLATLFGAVFTTSGLVVSYGPNLPAGATIIVIAGAVYLFATVFRGWINRFLRNSPL